ncbi:MAG: OmpA family protein [Candidatus Eisenbacteria sp.]|nr:OmpA family protein [Candidatus Eisenbacteria bacterium]
MADQAIEPEDTSEVTASAECDGGGGDECEAGAPKWVVTFGDMMSLLLCFFVILLSFSTMDVVRFRSLVGSLKSALGSKDAIAAKVITGKTTAVSLGENQPGRQSMAEEELEHELVTAVLKEGMTGEATLNRTDRGLVLRVRGNVLFETGSANILPQSMRLLRRVAWICRRFTRKVYIEGHTDNLPLRSEQYPSNWELSSARASAVVRYMLDMELLPPEKFVASGFAATVPIASNTTARGREKNRRVEFIFSGYPGDEP